MTAVTEALDGLAADTALPEARTIDIGGSAVRYRDTGGPGMPVLLTHGIGGSLELWNRQFDKHDPVWRLIAWDMPSHGLSGPAADDTSLEGIARQGLRLLQALGVGPALLAGNSLGGAVSLRMAAQSPQAVRGLLLVASAALGREVTFPFRLMTLPGLGKIMAKPGPMAVKQQVQAIVHRPEAITPDVLAAIERNVMRPGGAENFLALLQALTNVWGQKPASYQRSIEILRDLTVPVTFLHGQNDTVLPAAHSLKAHGLTPGSQLVVLADCGHTPQLEAAAAFREALQGLSQRALA